MSRDQFRLLLLTLLVVVVATYVISQRRLAAATARGLALAEEEAKRREAAQQTAKTLIACAGEVAEGLTRVAKAMAVSEMNRQLEAAHQFEAFKESNAKATWPPMGFTAMPFATE